MEIPSFEDITRFVTAVGMLLTALSSLSNRRKIGTIELKVDTAVIVAMETKKEAVEKIENLHTVTVEKIEEVKQDLQVAKAEAMQAIKTNGHNGGK
jgi:ribosome biogenesis SPOUT family RNA methylase Rps3